MFSPMVESQLFKEYLITGLYIWGFNPKRLAILHKRAVRILAFRPYLSHSTPLFKSLVRRLKHCPVIQIVL